MGFINAAFKNIPWALPGFPLVVLVILISNGWIAARLRVSRLFVVVVMLALGAVLLITLTPSTDSTLFTGLPVRRFCYFGVPHFPRVIDLTHIDERSLNVLLFAPLGLLVLLAPRWRVAVALSMLFVLLSPFVESVQYLLPAMGRTCTTSDVLGNLLGLFAGGVVGLILRLIALGISRLRAVQAQKTA